MVKGTDNAFEHMELCLVLQAVKLFFKRKLAPTTEFQGSNFLLPTFSIPVGSKRDFQVANLLFATVNFKP